ncbi:MAG: phosphate/phosphite/phosphonate ABC transporter substrate-binding protein [Sulfuricaulis sp.]|nr:phosphate/phosphite/phosphonate ABC transporter substrate-binding protein [Sulfuricaulis sp.]
MTTTAAGMMSLGAMVFAVGVGAAEQNVREKFPAARKAFFAPPETATSRPSFEGVARGMPAGSDNMLVFSAPPRETEEEGIRTYQPIAEYLSRITGKTIVYKHPGDWLTYQTQMQRGSYDLVFDGPHFNSWRISNLQHSTLVKIAGEHVFAVVVRKNDNRITDIKQLAGQKLCGMNPPNLGTLAVLGQFDNPARQPLIMNNVGWTKAYEDVAFEKKCAAAIVPLANLKKFSNSENIVRIVYKTKVLPNQAFSAGPRISREDQARIAAALVSPEASRVVSRLIAANGADQGLAFASKSDYTGLDVYLKDSWGYGR